MPLEFQNTRHRAADKLRKSVAIPELRLTIRNLLAGFTSLSRGDVSHVANSINEHRRSVAARRRRRMLGVPDLRWMDD
jgi:hypothetical protein